MLKTRTAYMTRWRRPRAARSTPPKKGPIASMRGIYDRPHPPAHYLLGTDDLGRDVLSRT